MYIDSTLLAVQVSSYCIFICIPVLHVSIYIICMPVLHVSIYIIWMPVLQIS